MTHADLKKWRFRAPFVIAGACVLPYFIVTVTPVADALLINQLIVPLIAMIVAFLYVGLDIRRWHWKSEIRATIGPQIRTALLAMLPEDLHVSDEERTILSREDLFKDLTGVFWEAVDRDPQLVAHKPHFYANGVIYTTAIDVYILAALGGFCYVVGYFATTQRALLALGAGFLLIALVSRYLVVPRVRAKHLALSAEQLDLLRRNQRTFVETRFREIVLSRRREGVLGGGASGNASE